MGFPEVESIRNYEKKLKTNAFVNWVDFFVFTAINSVITSIILDKFSRTFC